MHKRRLAVFGLCAMLLADLGADVYAPSVRLATDNAAMIARAGLFHAERGEKDGWALNAFASRNLG